MFRNKKIQVFISYRRDGGESMARLMYDRLTQDGYRVFLDVELLKGPGLFNEKIYEKIKECTDFLLILPKGGLDRCTDEKDWVRLEIEHALLHKKNIIPVLMRDFVFPDNLPDSLAKLPYHNGIPANMNLFDEVLHQIEKDYLQSKSHPKASMRLFLIGAFSLIFLALGFWLFSGFSQLDDKAEDITSFYSDNDVSTVLSYSLYAYQDLTNQYHSLYEIVFRTDGKPDQLREEIGRYEHLRSNETTFSAKIRNIPTPESIIIQATKAGQAVSWSKEPLDRQHFLELCELPENRRNEYKELVQVLYWMADNQTYRLDYFTEYMEQLNRLLILDAEISDRLIELVYSPHSPDPNDPNQNNEAVFQAAKHNNKHPDSIDGNDIADKNKIELNNLIYQRSEALKALRRSHSYIEYMDANHDPSVFIY